MKKLKVGVMGCANIAWRAMIPAVIQCEETELFAVASRSKERSSKFALQFNCKSVEGYLELLDLNTIDVIYMPLPTGLHEEWVIKTLEAGKHILVEKSFAQNVKSAQRMLEFAKSKNLLIWENFNFPHHSQFSWIKDKLSSGDLGDIHLLRSTFGFPHCRKIIFVIVKNLGVVRYSMLVPML